MSYDYSFSFEEPATPPHYSYEPSFHDASFDGGMHSRSNSHVSIYSEHSSPESYNAQLSTPVKSPIRPHGPLLLPKIRSQDQEIHETTPKPNRKMPYAPAVESSVFNLRPSHTRSYTNPESLSMLSPLSTTASSSHSRSSSAVCSPITYMVAANPLQRRASGSSLDGQTLGKYGFPTYRQLPAYIPSGHGPSSGDTFMPQQSYNPCAPREPSPMRNELSFSDFADFGGTDEALVPGLTTTTDGSEYAPPMTSILEYLTSANPAPSLVRQLNVHIRDASSKHFWWDVRQIRPWTAFSAASIAAVPGLLGLLTVPLSEALLPPPPPPPARGAAQHPETEQALHATYAGFYLPKLNTALRLSQGQQRHLVMRSSLGAAAGGRKPTGSGPSASEVPCLQSAYSDDTSALVYGGRGLGRVVGLVKSFDRWNSGMRVEGNHRRVEYLRGLAHLHACMRANGCRYGFIITEIELCVVRNGADATPHFGYLEIQTVQLAARDDGAPAQPQPQTSATASTSSSSSSRAEEAGASFGSEQLKEHTEREEPQQQQRPLKMTALLALWYMHMLARDDVLPGQAHWRAEIGAPAEGTRRKCLPKDEWIPEPQVAEKREAKRARGWVWCSESVGRKELGKRGVRYGGA